METDKQLYRLFTAATCRSCTCCWVFPHRRPCGPVRRRSRTCRPNPIWCSNWPRKPNRRGWTEFQAYRDKRFVPKVMLRCALYRLQHPARPMRCHIIYLDREFESVPVDDGGLFQPTVHYLPELLRQLTIQYPDSPLLSVLRPLVADSEEALIATAMADHERIRQAAGLTDEQRQAWLDVFHCWLMIRSATQIGGDTKDDRETTRSRRDPLGPGTQGTVDRRSGRRSRRSTPRRSTCR